MRVELPAEGDVANCAKQKENILVEIGVGAMPKRNK